VIRSQWSQRLLSQQWLFGLTIGRQEVTIEPDQIQGGLVSRGMPIQQVEDRRFREEAALLFC